MGLPLINTFCVSVLVEKIELLARNESFPISTPISVLPTQEKSISLFLTATGYYSNKIKVKKKP